ncbi:hypothetical protein [Variovorax sp. RA8]|uniref:hypothetical protein n=1 Tax=Variovorax sp. (strain JCM 16519 / RA8) TaxID=662548 RepID=UPI001319AF97|nr:hypothetical protein [Variovorax sp. RA8]VTU44214.1 hypothetical protein RA8P2_00097 [Variovorax sp. RA8]
MSQTPTYWRKLKLRLIESAAAYAAVLEREARGEDLGRALRDARFRYDWNLFELGPRNIAALAERSLARAEGSVGGGSAEATQNLVERAKEMARVQSLCNHPDKARREVWGRANDRYDGALEAMGPGGLADLVRRDLDPNAAILTALDDDGQDAADFEGAEAHRP